VDVLEMFMFLFVAGETDNGARTLFVITEDLESESPMFNVKMGGQANHVCESSLFGIRAAFGAVQTFARVLLSTFIQPMFQELFYQGWFRSRRRGFDWRGSGWSGCR
jgi:hypothetical protein